MIVKAVVREMWRQRQRKLRRWFERDKETETEIHLLRLLRWESERCLGRHRGRDGDRDKDTLVANIWV